MRLRLLERYSKMNTSSFSLIEFPNKISRKRVLGDAWMLYNNEPGVPGYFGLTFSEALKISWNREKDLINSHGAIYGPWIMS